MDHSHYMIPIGEGDLKGAVEALIQDSEERGHRFQMGLNADNLDRLLAVFPDRFEIIEQRDYSDYIYTSQSLATLAGKKLHSKRNFVNRFLQENPDWSYEPITAENRAECLKMNEEWCAINGCHRDPELLKEACYVKRVFQYFDELGMIGGLIRAGGRIVAYSFGEPISRNTFVVHVEKAFSDVTGAYPMINQQFVQHNCMEYEFVNREEDTGDEGLRKAKLSYKPVRLLTSYLAKCK